MKRSEMAPSTLAAGGAEGTGGGAVSVLSTPPPPSMVCAALDYLLKVQQTHTLALRRLRTSWMVIVVCLTAAVLIAPLI